MDAVATTGSGPVFEHPSDITPVAPIVRNGLGDGIFDPLRRVALNRRDNPVGDLRREQADVLLIQPKHVGPFRFDCRRGSIDQKFFRRSDGAGRHAREPGVVIGRVDIVPDLRFRLDAG